MAKREKASSDVQHWLNIIRAYEKEYKPWENRVEKILERYRDEKRNRQDTDNPSTRFNILWANVQTLVPATFARLPQPDVSRRFSDRDPVGRVAALILERALDFEIQHYRDYRSTMRQAVTDRFLGGRGTAWARYEPHIKAEALQQPLDGVQVTEDTPEEQEPQEQLDYECAPVDYVHWKDFGHTVARTWEEVTAVWRAVYMTRDACVARFGEKTGNKIPLDATPDDLKRSDTENPEMKDSQRACVYEIWDKENEEAIWLSKSMKEVLDKKDDPLGLEDFFPCPRPLYATMTNESLIPVPDFTLYQDQARELDLASERIDGLLNSLQVKGVYDASLGVEIARLFTDAGNTDLRPVKNWQAFAEKNGLKGAIDIVDLKPIADALKEGYTAMEQIKNQVYEITGISDIVRGQTQGPAKTATEQKIKGQYASLRLRAMQQDVAVFATELLKLKAQIVSGFDAKTLAQIAAVDQLAEADKPLVPQALQLIANKPLRSFRVEIAADSLVQIDEREEKESRVEFLTAIGAFMKGAVEVGGAAPQLAPLIMELLKFGVTGFKVGKTIEGTIDQAIEELKQAAKQPKPPDPEVEKERMKLELEKEKMVAEQQNEQAKMQLEREKTQNDIMLQKEKMAADQAMQRETMERDFAMKQEMGHQDMQFKRESHANDMGMKRDQFDRQLAQDGELRQAKQSDDKEVAMQKAELSTRPPVQIGGTKEVAQMTQSMQQTQQQLGNVVQSLQAMIQQLAKVMGAPKRIVRGPDGRAQGVEIVQ